MHRFRTIRLAAALGFALVGTSALAQTKPVVQFIATGGTIAMNDVSVPAFLAQIDAPAMSLRG